MKLSSKTALIALCLPIGAVCQTPGIASNTHALVAAAGPMLPRIPGMPQPTTGGHMAVVDTIYTMSTKSAVNKGAAASFLAHLTELAK